jgi:hypothetical protein
VNPLKPATTSEVPVPTEVWTALAVSARELMERTERELMERAAVVVVRVLAQARVLWPLSERAVW